MNANKNKVVIIGTGLVGTSYAYSLINKGVADEIVLIDVNKKKALGEAIDLSHGIPFAPLNTRVSAGEYNDCADARIVAIAAGVSQKVGESRIDLLNRNAEVFHSIIPNVMKSGFDGVFLVATNPVDIMTQITSCICQFPRTRVIGSGTVLDTSRLRYAIGDRIGVDPRNIHAYVLGEHGESEFIPWSQATVGTKEFSNYISHNARLDDNIFKEIENEVRSSAAQIIEAKGATCYGIGMAMTRITQAILSDENSILTVSTCPDGEYGLNDVWLGLPAIVGRGGVREIIELNLKDYEIKKLHDSADYIKNASSQIRC